MTNPDTLPTLPARSLLLRLALAMGTITALAFASMASSVFFAEAMRGAAGAINQAGTLRMQSYLIAARLASGETSATVRQQLAADYDARLASPRLTSVLLTGPDDEARASYIAVAGEWTHRIRPMLLATTADAERAQRFLVSVAPYVVKVDDFVSLLERRTESKVRWLYLIHMVSLFLTLAVVVLTMYMMHVRVLLPLRDLLACARHARRGDFSQRTPYESEDEFGQLGRAFNTMAEDLSKIYADLEERVRIKTTDLERSNRSLELLYSVAVRLNQNPLPQDALRALLPDLETALGVGPTAICLNTADGCDSFYLAGTHIADAGDASAYAAPHCHDCAPTAASTVAEHLPQHCPRHSGHTFPVRDHEQSYGVLVVGTLSRELQAWQSRLLEAAAAQIGTAITNSRRAEQSRRLALFEERAVIARELHDSLAQSLSYLKIQTSRLDAVLQKNGPGSDAQRVIKELREGVGSAYRQLRELLSTFRLRMDGRGLAPALEATVHEFQNRSGIPIAFNYRMERCQLSPNKEIHVLQVVREALSNVVRHAQATQASVTVSYDSAAPRVTVTVDDNGTGIPPHAMRAQHYGLAIMDERAHSLGGTLHAFTRAQGGTRVQLVFSPPNADGATRAHTEVAAHA
ncbi:HAMP domain-containing protein [Sinimarinibacterium sp. CAU 1509]|uniref:ATP-binding protein n=1 Tax=Sinimarinibacterium sp. CAU 1509 TaxID=2562283 RepID=UPI0010AD83DD|nr:ATP-binding protein [Sinimarinibacterium sp. CAU 1509]TJY56242.1 HAMP domain-containing protein [Sinimarinibacterium sp. CAU 1509]